MTNHAITDIHDLDCIWSDLGLGWVSKHSDGGADQSAPFFSSSSCLSGRQRDPNLSNRPLPPGSLIKVLSSTRGGGLVSGGVVASQPPFTGPQSFWLRGIQPISFNPSSWGLNKGTGRQAVSFGSAGCQPAAFFPARAYYGHQRDLNCHLCRLRHPHLPPESLRKALAGERGEG